MTEKWKQAGKLWLVFLKIGLFTFGGGYAMIPLIQKEIVEKKKWISDEDILEIVAIAESTPGPIAINAATFVGFRIGGFLGAAAATMGVVLPSFFIILFVSFLIRQFAQIKAVQYAFRGIRAGVLALIIKALWSMYKQCRKDLFSHILIGAVFVLAAFIGVPVFLLIICCAVLGLAFFFAASGRNKP